MIGMLRGRVVSHAEDLLVIDVGGVGYEVLTTRISEQALAAAGSALGHEVTLHVHTHVREDAITLFGFATADEREAFRLLLGVSNVGPRTALALLSGLSVGELAEAVARRDLTRLSSVQGIGKKTAERLAFELGDKLGRFASAKALPLRSSVVPGKLDARGDLLSALANLGYKPAHAERAVAAVAQRLEDGEPFEAVLREALKSLAKP